MKIDEETGWKAPDNGTALDEELAKRDAEIANLRRRLSELCSFQLDVLAAKYCPEDRDEQIAHEAFCIGWNASLTADDHGGAERYRKWQIHKAAILKSRTK